MNRMFTGCLLILSCTLPVLGQSIAVKVIAPQREIKAGSDLFVTIRVTNVSKRAIDWGGCSDEGGVDLGYKYVCRDMATRRIVKNKTGLGLLTCGSRDPLKPHESFERDVRITGACEMGEPARYVVQVVRVGGQKRPVKSNKIEILVTP